MTRKILYLGPEEGRAWVQTELGSELDVEWATQEPADVDRKLPSAIAILDASMKVPLTDARLELASALRVVVTATTGADHIDSSALAGRGIPLLTLKTEREVLSQVNPAAELSWLLLLACARRFRGALSHVAAGEWDRTLFPGWMLRGRTLGIVGCGRLGEWMSRYATAFGMRVLGYDPERAEFPATIQPATLDRVLQEAHAVTLHVPLNEGTTRLIDAAAFSKMKRGAILVNTSRGAIVDEDALLDALRTGQLFAYGADVVEGEPEVAGTALFAYAKENPNVILTPHIGGFSPDALELVLRHTARRIRKHLGAPA
jgi:phosphoglycerate dehydrogenase-like enzyme